MISDEVSLFVSDSKSWFLWFLRQCPYISADIPLIEDTFCMLKFGCHSRCPSILLSLGTILCRFLQFARFKAVGGSCLAERLSCKRSFVFLQCYVIYPPAGFCPKYFLSCSSISILEVCPCHFKSLNIGLQTKYVDFCTTLKCLFTRYTLLLVRFLNF